MNKVRSRIERQADSFDADLYRLIDRARQHQDEWDGAGARENPWREVVGVLYKARPYIRGLMHKDDVAETQ